MKIDLDKKKIVFILNCINITIGFLEEHTYQEKDRLRMYFNFNNYYDDYNRLVLLHRLISTNANLHYYDIEDKFFIYQKEYLCTEEKDFNFKEDIKICNKFKKNKYLENKKCNFRKILSQELDNFNNVV